MQDDPFSPFLSAQSEPATPAAEKPPRKPRRTKLPEPPTHIGASSQTEYGQAAIFLKTLAHPLRLEIIALLSEHEEASAGVLEHFTDQPQTTIAHHLGILRRAGIVITRADGIFRFYRLTHPRAAHIATLSTDSRGPKSRH